MKIISQKWFFVILICTPLITGEPEYKRKIDVSPRKAAGGLQSHAGPHHKGEVSVRVLTLPLPVPRAGRKEGHS